MCQLIVGRPVLEVMTKRLLHQQIAIPDFSAMLHMEVFFIQLFLVLRVFLRSLIEFVTTDEFSERVTKITSKTRVLYLITTYLSGSYHIF